MGKNSTRHFRQCRREQPSQRGRGFKVLKYRKAQNGINEYLEAGYQDWHNGRQSSIITYIKHNGINLGVKEDHG